MALVEQLPNPDNIKTFFLIEGQVCEIFISNGEFYLINNTWFKDMGLNSGKPYLKAKDVLKFLIHSNIKKSEIMIMNLVHIIENIKYGGNS